MTFLWVFIIAAIVFFNPEKEDGIFHYYFQQNLFSLFGF